MGSRLRTNPDRILECFLEVAPTEGESNEGPSIKFIHPTDFDDKEALKAFPRFCFPCISKSEAVQSYTFVLTDIQGQYRFGFCRYSPNVNTCLCIVSYLPWFEMFYTLLNRISELQKSVEQNGSVVPLLNSLMSKAPPPQGSSFKIEPIGSNKDYEFRAPDLNKLPSIPENRNLTEYFAAIEPQNMITLFISMFFERRIIITSKKLSLLTACCYGAASLLYPMHWQHMFVPIVPSHLLDYCGAPMPFLVGVHSSLMPLVRRMPLDEVVILDADTNQIECPFDDASTLPQDVTHTMKSTLKKTVYPIDDHVSRAFLAAMVSLVGGYRNALRFHLGEQIVFDKDAFVMSRSSSMRPLLEFILQLQLFEQFISERLELLNSGKGFNDVFEEQIGLQAENHTQLKTQYHKWVKDMKRSSGAFLGKAGKTAKKGYKETKKELKVVGKGVKSNLSNLKGNLAEATRDLRDKLKGKDDDEEIGGQIKKSNSLPHIKNYQLGIKISPVGRRRAISPGQSRKAQSFRNDLLTDTKNVPRRPPPPRPNPYQSAVRPRTAAMSVVMDADHLSPQLETRHSAPNLLVDLGEETKSQLKVTGKGGNHDHRAFVRDGVSMNIIGETCCSAKKESKSKTDEQTPSCASLLDLSEALKDETLFETSRSNTESCPTKTESLPTSSESSITSNDSMPIESENTTTPPRPVPPRRTSSGKRPRPEVPPRPSRKCSGSSAVDEILSSPGSPQSPFVLTPLRPVSLDLFKDTMDSLPADVKDFLNEQPNDEGTVIDSTTKSSDASNTECLTKSLPPKIDTESENKKTEARIQKNSGTKNLVAFDNPFDDLHKKVETRTAKDTSEPTPGVTANATTTASSNWVSFD